MGALLRLLVGRTAGRILLAGVLSLVLGFGGCVAWDRWTIRGLERDVAALTAEKERLRADLSEVTANRDRLRAEIEEQNRRVAELAARARESDAAARLAASEALRAAERRTAALAGEPPAGPEEINRWVDALFTPPP